ncbi:MAG: hypothetical protein M0C28_07580 [Candidatus Moduliflexus flocculans]|nr:hypothetical protein [Candidatus Moduliflexus flocculans]
MAGARHRRRPARWASPLAWQIMTLASFFLIRFEHRKKENVRNADEVPRPHGARLAPRRRRGFLRRRVRASASPWPRPSRKLVGDERPAAASRVFGLAPRSASASRPASVPFGQLWLPDAHSIAPSPVSAPAERGHAQDRRSTGSCGPSSGWSPVANPAFDAGAWGLVDRRDRRGDALHRHRSSR